MIRRCLTVFRGIGPGRERALRSAGIADWQQLLDADELPGVPDRLRPSLRQQVRRWSGALES